jgi:hypothetical protein
MKDEKMPSFLINQHPTGAKTLLFIKATLLLSFLSITITACLMERNGGIALTPVESLPPMSNATPVVTIPPSIQHPEGRSFYVSTTGDNTDGRTWDTAWSELDQIQWEEITPGDRIVIEGGEYHSQMSIEKSGTSDLPITITTNGEQVTLDGKRPLPQYCGQANNVSTTGDDAIDLGSQSFIVIDGLDWSGIIIRNHLRGIKLREHASNIVIRNVEIYDNGYSREFETNVAPDGPGVRLGGSDILFERVIIHDNGQDAFQAGWGVWNFTLRNSWLYNSREHPVERGKAFNYCSHTDGIQIYGGGLQGPFFIENSIIGPSFTQGIIIGSDATVNNVVIKNTLFVGSDNAGIIISDGGQSQNWTLQNVTIVQDMEDQRSWNLKMNGTGHQINNSLFWGGVWGVGVFNWSASSENFNWLTPDQYDIAEEMDPMFVDDNYSLIQGNGFADFDFTIQNPAIPSGTGASITSLAKLFDQ